MVTEIASRNVFDVNWLEEQICENWICGSQIIHRTCIGKNMLHHGVWNWDIKIIALFGTPKKYFHIIFIWEKYKLYNHPIYIILLLL